MDTDGQVSLQASATDGLARVDEVNEIEAMEAKRLDLSRPKLHHYMHMQASQVPFEILKGPPLASYQRLRYRFWRDEYGRTVHRSCLQN